MHLGTVATLVSISATLVPLVWWVVKKLKARGAQQVYIIDSLKKLQEAVLEMSANLAVDRVARRTAVATAMFETLMTEDNQRVLYTSPGFTRLTGLSREDCENEGWIRCVHSTDRDRVARLARRAFEDETVMSTIYTVQNVQTGKKTLVEHTSAPALNAGMSVVGWVGHLNPLEEP